MVIKGYPGSFDPVHKGHAAVIEDAAADAEKLYVLVGKNPAKQGLLPLQTKIDLLQQLTQDIPNVIVDSYDGLLVDYCAQKGISTIVKGIRDDKDRSFEKTQEYYNSGLNSDIITEYVECRPEYFHLSSSAVKELILRGGNVGKTDHLIPVYVKKEIEQRLNNQYMLGVTGVPGSGKSYVTRKFTQYCEEFQIPHYLLDMDKLRHRIAESEDPDFFQTLRDQIVTAFPEVRKTPEGSLVRSSARDAFLGQPEKLAQLMTITTQSIMSLLRSTLWQKQGAIIVENALFTENEQLLHLVNNDMVVVDVDTETQYKRIAARNSYYDSKEKIKSLVNLQADTPTKIARLKEAIATDKQGAVITLENPDLTEGESDHYIYYAFLKSLATIDPQGKLYFQGLRKRGGGKGDRKTAYNALTQNTPAAHNVYLPTIRGLHLRQSFRHFAWAYNAQDNLETWLATYLP